MAAADERRPPVIHEGLPTQLPDIDPEETQEWLDSLDAMRRTRPESVNPPPDASLKMWTSARHPHREIRVYRARAL